MAARAKVTSSGGIDFSAQVKRLTRAKVLVGIPNTAAERPPEPGAKGKTPSNATLGMVHEFGDDEKHIPARPFLVPGIRSVQPEIVKLFRKAGEDAFDRDFGQVLARFEGVGLIAVAAVQTQIKDGLSPPLSDRTIRERAERRHKDTGKLKRDFSSKRARDFLELRAQGTPDWALNDAGLAKPLFDTTSMYRSIQFIVKDGNG